MGALSGCVPTVSPETTTFIQQVQADAVGICGWLPVADTIVGLFPGVPADALKAAELICKAVASAPKPAARGAIMAVTVNGQTVQGSFVRR